MAAFRIELLHRADDDREPFLADRYDIHTPDLEATVVQARLFGALFSARPSLVSFRIWDDGLIAYEATKMDLMPKGASGEN